MSSPEELHYSSNTTCTEFERDILSEHSDRIEEHTDRIEGLLTLKREETPEVLSLHPQFVIQCDKMNSITKNFGYV